MIQVIVTVKDTAAQAFGRPMFVPTVAVALRSFRDEVNRSDPQNDMFRHADDFEMYELGSFDDATGVVSLLDSPRLCARAKDLKDV